MSRLLESETQEQGQQLTSGGKLGTEGGWTSLKNMETSQHLREESPPKGFTPESMGHPTPGTSLLPRSSPLSTVASPTQCSSLDPRAGLGLRPS